jgi:putative hydrolase of the HAD superfamily
MLLKKGSQDLAPVRVIFFDAVGTLFRLRRSVGESYAAVAAEHGISLDAKQLDRVFAELWATMPPRPTTRRPRAEDDRGWWRALVDKILERCGASFSAPVRADYFEALYASFTRPGVWELFPDVEEQLTLLAKHYRLGVISNFDRRLRSILETLGIARCFTHLVISSEVGADKPDPWIFRAGLRAANVPPGEALHVGDDPIRDWQGAAAVGLKVFPLVRDEQTIEDLTLALRLGGRPAVGATDWGSH